MFKKLFSNKILRYSVLAVCLLLIIYIIMSLITFNNLPGKAKGILAKELSNSEDVYTSTYSYNYFLSYENFYYEIDKGIFSATVHLSGSVNITKNSKSSEVQEVPFRAKVKIGFFNNKISSVYINGKHLYVFNDNIKTRIVVI